MSNSILIAGAGFTGLSLAAHLASKGFQVEIFEKNDFPGGKAHRFSYDQFFFDQGPTAIVFPEILDHFFHRFNHSLGEVVKQKRVAPSCRLFFGPEDHIDLMNDAEGNAELFAKHEKRGDKKFWVYMKRAREIKNQLVDENLYDLMIKQRNLFRPQVKWFQKAHNSYVKSLFRSEKLIKLLENPLPFLGTAVPHLKHIPFACNYNILSKGLNHPMGGTIRIAEGMIKILDELQVAINLDSNITSFDIIEKEVSGVLTSSKNFHASHFATAIDYRSAEHLLTREYRNYPETFWNKKSARILLYHIGLQRKIPQLAHHNLIFEEYFNKGGIESLHTIKDERYKIIYIACPSKTESTTAPKGMESITVRMNIPPGIEDTGKMREHFFFQCLQRIEQIAGKSLSEDIVYKKTFAMADFESEYQNYSGNVFSIFNSFRSPFAKNPRFKNKHINNLYYAEMPLILGPGIHTSILSGEIVAGKIFDDLSRD